MTRPLWPIKQRPLWHDIKDGELKRYAGHCGHSGFYDEAPMASLRLDRYCAILRPCTGHYGPLANKQVSGQYGPIICGKALMARVNEVYMASIVFRGL